MSSTESDRNHRKELGSVLHRLVSSVEWIGVTLTDLEAEGGVSFVFFLTGDGGTTKTGKAGLLPWKRLYRKATAVASAAG